MTANFFAERRRFQRIDIEIPVRYTLCDYSSGIPKIEGEEKQGTSIDISENGLAILIGHRIAPSHGDTIYLSVKFRLPNSDPDECEISAIGQIRYCLELEEGGKCRIGIDFINIEGCHRIAIAAYMNAKQNK